MGKKIIGNLVGTTLPRIQVDEVLDANSNNAIANKVVAEIVQDFDNRDESYGQQFDNHDERITAIEPFIFDNGDANTVEQDIENNYVVYYGIVSRQLIVYMSPMATVGFSAALYFTTPSEIPANYTYFYGDVYFKGDSTDNGAFVPEANMRYTIVFDFDGYMINGYVNGVPAPSVSEVSEGE